ncbi:MAG TPA: transglutaminase family protein [Egicoccus sp.]|nr:transglutaminase family protein [Egicoccus sp.]HSK23371.1 transglutaminase family protein [Egicoccus sp.]
MPQDTRRRLVSLVRRHDADLAEAGLLIGAEAEPGLDVDGALLRLDALADGLRVVGIEPGDPEADASALAHYLGTEQGFTASDEPGPDAVLLTGVLDAKRGVPVTLTMLYVAIARRLRIQAYPIALPGLVVVGIAGGEQPLVLDPSRGGRRMAHDELVRHVSQATAGQLGFRRSMLRPSPTVNVVRRQLNELTRAYVAEQRLDDARWAVELKLLLPNRLPDDHRVLGDLLAQGGQFHLAAAAYERYLDLVGPDAPDAAEVRQTAIRARARLN